MILLFVNLFINIANIFADFTIYKNQEVYDRHDLAEILLKVALNTIKQTN